MGTRGFTGFLVNDELKIGYQQFDSYPSGVGIQVLEWLRGVKDVSALRDLATQLKVVSDATPPTPEDVEALQKYTSLGVASQSTDDWYCLLRNAQGRPDLILEAGYILDASDFPTDSLFCEWGYLIDLDTETFEVYEGFQKTVPTEGHWAGQKSAGEPGEYAAVERVGVWPLSALPAEKDFLALEESNEDEG